MLSQDVEKYRKEVKVLEDETARGSEQVLSSQEERFSAALGEVTQSIASMSQDSELVVVDYDATDGNGISKQIIDPLDLVQKIAELDKLVELLKLTHLEQETLDFFLRYTISSADLLRLKTTHDTKYLKLENTVKEMEIQISDEHQQEIDNTKLKISSTTEELAKAQNLVNETYLETTEVLDECEQLIKELEESRKEHNVHHEQSKVEQNPVEKLYEQWEELRKSKNNCKIMDEQMKQLEVLKKSYEARDISKVSEASPDLIELGTSLSLLIQLWESNFLSIVGWKNLELYPQTRKFQFDVGTLFTVVISLDDSSCIRNIVLYKKGDFGIAEEGEIQTELRQHNLGSKDIYKSMENIVAKLQSLKN